MNVWAIVALLCAGIAFDFAAPGRLTFAFGHATLYVFLPALLFEAAWNLHYRAIVRQWPAIATLAGPGVLLTAVVVAGALSVVGVPFGPALLTGAILSATDPIVVIAIFRRLRVSRTLATIVECESLFNDAVAVVLYRAVLVVVATGAASRAAVAIVGLRAVCDAAGGILFGILLAFGAAWLLRYSRLVNRQILATIVCAYGSYFAADYLGLSGIFAVVACGIALRYFERRWITLTIADEVRQFWDVVALVANGLVFFLTGAALEVTHVLEQPWFVVACLAGISLSRALVAGLLLPGGYPREWIDVVRTAGVRGALSLALAIALPASIPYRDAIIDGTFAVALATIIVSALTAERVVRRAATRR